MNALQSFADGSRSGKRNQTVYTPQSIVDALLRLWPEGIAMDPCSGPDSIVPAQWHLMPPINGCRYDKKAGPAFIEQWPERTYVNPPFNNLKPWIRQFCESIECVLLVPVRTHRAWWRVLLKRSVICWLNPLRFVGYKQSFPAPLALCYRGLLDFEDAVDGLGQVGFACDVCGGRHSSTYSCESCGAWVCVRHADITITQQEYAPPIKKAKCRGCIH